MNTPAEAVESTEPVRKARGAYLRVLLGDSLLRRRVLLVFGIVAMLIFGALAAVVRVSSVLPVDVWVTRELQEDPRPILFQTTYAISIFGYQPWSAMTVVAGSILVGLLLGLRSGAFLFGATIAQGLINAGIKLLVGRPRPVSSLVQVIVPENGNSFPSGHVMFYTLFFGMLCFLIWTHVRVPWLRWPGVTLCAALIALIGPSRMILGSHWFSDVIAAYLIGLLLLGFAIEGYVSWIAPEHFGHPVSKPADSSFHKT